MGCRILPIFLAAMGALAQTRAVAITVDDLPGARGEQMIAAMLSHRVPVVAFVIQKKAEALG